MADKLSTFRKFINKDEIIIESQNHSKNNKHSKSDSEYFDEVNPDTGLKYDIPGLSYTDNDYFFEYVRYMKMKEKDPEKFKQIINWG